MGRDGTTRASPLLPRPPRFPFGAVTVERAPRGWGRGGAETVTGGARAEGGERPRRPCAVGGGMGGRRGLARSGAGPIRLVLAGGRWRGEGGWGAPVGRERAGSGRAALPPKPPPRGGSRGRERGLPEGAAPFPRLPAPSHSPGGGGRSRPAVGWVGVGLPARARGLPTAPPRGWGGGRGEGLAPSGSGLEPVPARVGGSEVRAGGG